MAPSSGPDGAEDVTMDPITLLSRLPLEAQLLLRDYIAGLEAQAGSARVIADRLQRVREQDVDRLLLKVAGARAERDAAVAERDKAFAERDAAVRTIVELTGRHQVAPVETPEVAPLRRSWWGR